MRHTEYVDNLPGEHIVGTLIDWFAHQSRPLPWREPDVTPWAILVCEVMSQQTPVARVLPQWHAWMDKWPTPKDLAQAPTAEVLVAWGKLGYPRRALRLQECATVLAEKWDNEVPSNREDLLNLPGIGPYTADAVLGFAFRKRSVVLDTNIRRVLARLSGVAAAPTSPREYERQRADALVPSDGEDAAQYNAAIMELGALVCTARNPACESCPISEECAWFQAGKPDNGPVRKTQKFAGTQREARGKIMAVLRSEHAETGGEHPPVDMSILHVKSGLPEKRFTPALHSLLEDGLIHKAGKDSYTLPR